MHTSSTQHTRNGFSTLLIVIILGGIALALTLSLSTSGVWSIRSSIDSKTSNTAKSLVDACAEIALEVVRENNAYTGTNAVLLHGNTCTYSVGNTGGATRLLSVVGSVGDITRKLTITTSAFNPLTISSWQEAE